ncbi:MAG: hypothetical protein G3M78_02575 [Candidatus Nitrohelix vancouverensis]|uniref:biotin synthase n=1 Tax=Candidatus Nitrohelix vancouverensis TaxID=2705534 RepID=A0A7T0G2H4_9BACT|nr:MAG: hypothetical protein G3M78_02575 [Candidatus Nitrohelix vancouverensis]
MNIVQLSLLQNDGCAGGCKFCGLSLNSEVERELSPSEIEFQKSFDFARSSNARLELVFPSVGTNQREVLGLLTEMSGVIQRNADVDLAINPGLCTRPEFYDQLASLGVKRYRNNLESSRRLFQDLVPSRPLAQDTKLESLTLARASGLSVDTGWLCGLGETEADIDDILELLEASTPDSITLNFFDPREAAEAFEHTQPSHQAGLDRYEALQARFPGTELTLGGAYELWMGADAQQLLKADGVYVGRFLDHGIEKSAC